MSASPSRCPRGSGTQGGASASLSSGTKTGLVRLVNKGITGKEPTDGPLSGFGARRALIVDDEIIFAINLEADMHALGFDICDLAANGQQASKIGNEQSA
jgi:hypothetical protein